MKALRAIRLPGLFGLLLLGLPALAHRAHESLLHLRTDGTQVEGRWDIGMHDLTAVLAPKDANVGANGEALLGRLRLAAGADACTLSGHRQERIGPPDDATLVLHFVAQCAATPRELTVDLRAIFSADARHVALLSLESGAAQRTAAMSADDPIRHFIFDTPHWTAQLASDVRAGIWHIVIGYDHVLFLLALLLPATLPASGEAVHNRRRIVLDVLKVITAFTAAHSLTLTGAALGFITLPAQLTESAIALTVLLAALMNLREGHAHARWPTAFAFGLVHGFGFASALAGLGSGTAPLVWTVLGFNVGVELGQLAIVLLFLPLAFAASGSTWYGRLVLRGGSALIALVAAAWFIERAFDVQLLPGWS